MQVSQIFDAKFVIEGEKGCVHIVLFEPKSDEKGSQFLKPLSVCLFETIDELLIFNYNRREEKRGVSLEDYANKLLHEEHHGGKALFSDSVKIVYEGICLALVEVLGGGGDVSVEVEDGDVVSGLVGVVLVVDIVGDGVVIDDGVGGGFVSFVGEGLEGDVGSDVMGVFEIGVCEVCGGARIGGVLCSNSYGLLLFKTGVGILFMMYVEAKRL
ncbi:hypothetical protein Tco_0808657 [Tanacetum coccineum]